MPRLSCFWHKACAMFIDGVVFMILSYLLGLMQLGVFTELLLSLVFYFCGMAWMMSSSFLTTPGGLVMGVKIVSEEYLPLSFQTALLRCFVSILSWMLFGFGYFIAAIHPKNQTLHDIVAKSVVLTQSDKRNLWYFLALIVIWLVSSPFIHRMEQSQFEREEFKSFRS